MRKATVIVGLLAVTAAGGTALGLNHYVDSIRAQQSAQATTSKPSTLGVLVAAVPIDAGKTLDPTLMQWQQWPESVAHDAAGHGAAVSDAAGQAAAQKPYEGSIARITLLKGEPITDDKVAHPSGGSTLSVILRPGMRSMTLAVSPIIGAGGMVQPGDRVDILLTADLNDIGAGTVDPRSGRMHPHLATETILQDVKVLAADRRLAPNPDPAVPVPAAVTFEVTPEQAEKLVVASTLGRFTLVMRPLATGGEIPRVGLNFATDATILPEIQAERRGVTVDSLDPRENPFIVPAPPMQKRKDDSIVVYRWTSPSVVPVENGRVVDDGQQAAGSLPAPDAPAAATHHPATKAPTASKPAASVPIASSEGDDSNGGYYGAVAINKAAASYIGSSRGFTR